MNLSSIAILPVPRLVFFPSTSLPLHIVEPVYVSMIKNIAKKNGLMGITLAEAQLRDGHLKYTPKLICTVGQPIILEEYHDGSIKVLVHAKARVRLINLIQSLPYLIFEAQELGDRHEPSALTLPHTKRLVEILDNWLLENIPDSIEREHFQQSIDTLQAVANYLCMFLIQDPETRQIMLENTSLFERINLLNGLLKGDHPQFEDWLTKEAMKEFEILEQKICVNH